MPLIQAAPTALSQTYARSLYELAEAKGGRAAIEESLAELEAIVDLARQDPRFAEFLSSRAIGADARAASLERILKGRCSDLVRRFLLVLNEKGRLQTLAQVAAAYDAIVQEKFGRVEVDVFTAEPASREQLDQIRQRVGASLGKDVVIHPYTDASMLGGVKLRIGDMLVDASLATKLRNLRGKLQENGLSRLRAKMDRVLGS